MSHFRWLLQLHYAAHLQRICPANTHARTLHSKPAVIHQYSFGITYNTCTTENYNPEVTNKCQGYACDLLYSMKFSYSKYLGQSYKLCFHTELILVHALAQTLHASVFLGFSTDSNLVQTFLVRNCTNLNVYENFPLYSISTTRIMSQSEAICSVLEKTYSC